MRTITVTEFKKNFGKYNILGQSEEIIVTYRGQTIYHIVPKKTVLARSWGEFFNTLPADADLENVDREN